MYELQWHVAGTALVTSFAWFVCLNGVMTVTLVWYTENSTSSLRKVLKAGCGKRRFHPVSWCQELGVHSAVAGVGRLMVPVRLVGVWRGRTFSGPGYGLPLGCWRVHTACRSACPLVRLGRVARRPEAPGHMLCSCCVLCCTSLGARGLVCQGSACHRSAHTRALAGPG